MQKSVIESILTNVSVIRASFQTRDIFPQEDPIRQDLQAMEVAGRENLIELLRKERDSVQEEFAFDVRAFKTIAVDLTLLGYPRRTLDQRLKLDAFHSVANAEGIEQPEDALYFYEFYPPLDLLSARLIPASLMYKMFLIDVLHAAENGDNYADIRLFDRNVFQKNRSPGVRRVFRWNRV